MTSTVFGVPTAPIPCAGDIAQVRHRQYLVNEVVAPSDVREQHTLVRLTCLDDDAQGRPLSVLWERELAPRVIRPEQSGLGTPQRIDEPRHFAAYLHALKWSSVTATDARLFQAPFRAGIHLLDHQLTPLRKALELPRVNLFIADDVGLGKTIEAGLVMQELILRQRVDRVLIVCPASVTLQWRDEMEKRFGLRFEIFNGEFVSRRRQERGFQVPVWSTHSRFIVSYQTLRRSEYFEPLKTLLEEKGPHKSMLVLDEAHVVAPASANRYAVDTETTQSIRSLAERFEHRLFLSATPHNGHSNSFSALLEMLDPQRFTRGTRVRESQLAPVMVRRLKSDLRALGSAQRYPERQVVGVRLAHTGGRWGAEWLGPDGKTVEHTVDLGEGSPVELELSQKLARYTQLLAPTTKKSCLVFINLQKRLLSSIEAFHRTLSVHAAASGAVGLAPDGGSLTGDAPSESEEHGETDESLELALDEAVREDSQGLSASVQARQLLDEMLKLSARHRTARDAKLRALLHWVREHQCPLTRGAAWKPRRVILFTEYGDTLRYLKEQLTAAFEGTQRGDERILTLTGGLDDAKRAEVQAAFNGPLDEFPVRFLLATDAAREGINLQGHCADLFHFDVPWNPSRMEQRNGRIDRALQPEPVVRCGYFVYAQRAEDAVLDTVARKVDTIVRELGSLGSVLMDQMHDALAQGITQGTLESVSRAATSSRTEVTKRELESQRTLQSLRKELDAIGELRERSREVMDFDPALLRDALDVGFELAGAGRMERAEVTEEGRTLEAWKVPALPPSWNTTLDAIRPRRERDEAPWEWRERPLSPVVFEAPPGVSSKLAHLHLSHPIVQRVLQRFLAQGFSANDLSRITVVRSKRDSVARVIIFGRLSLFGAGAARLHDEVVSVSAKWLDGGGKGHLKPFADEADRKAIEQLETTLAEAPALSSMPRSIQARLLASASSDFAKLWSFVEEQASQREQDARKKLAARGTAESKALTQILLTQQETIQEALSAQLELKLGGREEQDQWRRDKVHLEQRLTALKKELVEQPQSLKTLYAVQVARVVPVGMVYLWPVAR
ncbi:DISARM system SNF2-like helicase DrmD [Corallococcus silvisoli]|uniref:DISARM system SNF2-like helicase DrmD n=1 Tax=Corallococcus silvisoli TaxID=2697031 RepID=UPI0013774898|nr:DISARM system SNF2-like helicase DrmD [Corallococcus silvisoli]NBD12652.1 DEAD/DEAH box helicase family protein [Corallococcus silvisoli]